MNLEDIKKRSEEIARGNTSNESDETVAQIEGAFKFLKDGGVNVDRLNVSFQGSTFHVAGTVEEGNQLETLKSVIDNSGSESTIINTVELEDLSPKNIKLKVKTKGSNLNVRAGAGTDNDIVGKFANGAEVLLVKKVQADWYLVRNNETEGYCHTNFLSI